MRADGGLPARYTPRELAARERRRRRGRVEVTISRNRVIMALCSISDSSGTFIEANVQKIAEAAGVSDTTAKKRLTEMEERGELVGFRRRSLSEPLNWVLMDAPHASEAVNLFLEYGFEIDAASRTAQARASAVEPNEISSKQI